MKILKKIVGRIACLFGHHARGKRVNEINGVATFRCPRWRCGAYWTRRIERKDRKPKGAA